MRIEWSRTTRASGCPYTRRNSVFVTAVNTSEDPVQATLILPPSLLSILTPSRPLQDPFTENTVTVHDGRTTVDINSHGYVVLTTF